MAKGYSQVEGIDYEETFAHAARYSSIRVIPSLDAHMGWKINQMDVNITFLNRVIERRCTSSNHKVLRHLIESIMCTDSSEHYMVSNKQLVLGTPGLTIISLVLASRKVKWMKTSIIFL